MQLRLLQQEQAVSQVLMDVHALHQLYDEKMEALNTDMRRVHLWDRHFVLLADAEAEARLDIMTEEQLMAMLFAQQWRWRDQEGDIGEVTCPLRLLCPVAKSRTSSGPP